MNSGFAKYYKSLQVLTEEQIDEIHRGSLEVLENTGVKFENKRALELFEKNGCKVDHDNMIVKFPPGLVEESIQKCPSSIRLRARDRRNDINLGINVTYFSAFPGMRTVDLDTWEQKTPTIEDNHNAVKVLDSLENVHLTTSYSPYCELEGVPPVMLLPTSCWSRMKYFRKPFRIGQTQESWRWAIMMAQTLDIDVFGAFENSSPLAWSSDAIDCAWACAEAGYPVEVGTGTVMGGTGPATIAGSLVSSNAEMLSGVVMLQLIKPGLGTIANCFVFPQNMRTGAPGFGQIGISLYQAAYTQIWGSRYKVPTMLGACGPVASKPIDYQTGVEKAISSIIGALSGGTIINLIGGMYGELAHHPVQAVLDNDLAGMIGRFIEGIRVDEETLAVNLIEKVGVLPGHFLGESHTRKWHKKEQYIPHVFDYLTYPEWKKYGKKSALDYAKERVEEILSDYKHTLPESKEEELDRILEEARRYYKKKGLI